MKKHNGTKEQYEQFVKMTVDSLVAETDFPVVGQAMKDIADREELRKLVKKGILKTLYVTVGRGFITGYFTEDALPKFERERRAEANGTTIQHEQPATGEELVERKITTIQEVYDSKESGEVVEVNFNVGSAYPEGIIEEDSGVSSAYPEGIIEEDSGVVSSEGIQSGT